MSLIYLILTFLLLFGSKMSFLDIPVIIALIYITFFILFKRQKNMLKIDKKFYYLLILLLFFGLYSSVVMILYGTGELIFALKFFKTAILFFLLIILFKTYSKHIDYELFQKLIVYSVVLHSLIIFLNITVPEFREVIYSLSGYTPRGPEWSRSPGITISFNATAIIHLTALYILIFNNINFSKIFNFLAITIILVSLIFLGRTISLLGLSLIFLLFSMKNLLKSFIFVIIIGGTLLYLSEIEDTIENQTLTNVMANYNHFSSPLLSDDINALNYYDEVLSDHFYFSSDAKVLLFGNTNAGHIGLLGGKGETNSDIGLINSINANGIIVTTILYLFYFILIYLSKNGDWKIVTFIVVLNLALTLKETGFLVSHATVLLFLLVLYQYNKPFNLLRETSYVRNLRNK